MSFLLARLLGLMALSGVAYWMMWKIEPRLTRLGRATAYLVSAPAALFWLLFTMLLYRTLSTAWLTELRAIPGIEFTVALTGVFGALLQKRMESRKPPRDWISRNNGLILAGLVVIAAFIEPILFPFEDNFVDEWNGDVCLQSNGYTCGPATVATILRLYGIEATEEEIARSIPLSRNGSAMWDLMRELRRRGLRVRCVPVESPRPDSLPAPSIVAVRLGDKKGIPHVVVAFEQTPDSFTFGDPLTGRFTWSKEFTCDNYWFTGEAIQIVD